MGEVLRLTARRLPRKTAIIGLERSLTYAELDREANRFANAVLSLGLAKGDVVAVMSRNLPEYGIAFYGNARAGCLLVNLWVSYGPDEIVYILEKTEATVIVVEAEFADKVAAARGRLPALRHVIIAGAPAGTAAPAGSILFEDFIAGQPATPPDIALSEDDPFAMTFTGGTTGFPKGAVVSHRARFVSNWTAAIEHEVTEHDTVAVVTPMYHAIGLVVWWPTAVLVGATCVLFRGWEARRFVTEVARYDISAVMMVPVQIRELLSDGVFDAAKLATLKKIGSGGAVMPPELLRRLSDRLPGVDFTDHYGQSETGPLCILKQADLPEKIGTIGKPALGVDLELVDADGKPVPVGEVGELVVRGPFLMDGYYKDPVETAAYFKSGDGRGWTGDLGVADEDGFIRLVGRSKEMIISGGVNIYPREVELVLEKHPAVAECTVFGIPDDQWGEALASYVVLEQGMRALEDELIAHCAEHLARFKRPRMVRFVEIIPKTPSGKIQKQVLRDRFLREIGAG